VGNPDLGERAESRVDAVDSRLAGRLAIDERARRVDARDGGGRERHLRAAVRNGEQLFECQRGSVKKNAHCDVE
jgi:hypothetical protein